MARLKSGFQQNLKWRPDKVFPGLTLFGSWAFRGTCWIKKRLYWAGRNSEWGLEQRQNCDCIVD